MFLLISSRIQESVELLQQCKLPIDPCSKDRHVHLDIDNDQDHLVFVNSILDNGPQWVLENDHRI
jgi:hypothetical protein